MNIQSSENKDRLSGNNSAGKITAPLIVRDETRNYIDCLVMLNALTGKIGDAVNTSHGDNHVDEIMLKNFHPKIHCLKKVIQKFMCEVIDENLCVKDFSEI